MWKVEPYSTPNDSELLKITIGTREFKLRSLSSTGIEITEDNDCLLRLFKEEENLDDCVIRAFPKGLSAELLIHIFKVHGITSIDQDAIDQILASVKISF